MKKLLFVLLLMGCGKDTVQRQAEAYVCSCNQRQRVQDFVQASIKNANNMSDEEMEDVIRELYRVGVMLNCEIRIISEDATHPFIKRTRLDSCEFYMEPI